MRPACGVDPWMQPSPHLSPTPADMRTPKPDAPGYGTMGRATRRGMGAHACVCVHACMRALLPTKLRRTVAVYWNS